jgi:hypothetical protein
VLFAYEWNDQVKVYEMGGACSMHGAKRDAGRVFVRKREGRRPLGRPSCRWVDAINMVLNYVGLGDVDLIGLPQDRNKWRAVVNALMNPRVS